MTSSGLESGIEGVIGGLTVSCFGGSSVEQYLTPRNGDMEVGLGLAAKAIKLRGEALRNTSFCLQDHIGTAPYAVLDDNKRSIVDPGDTIDEAILEAFYGPFSQKRKQVQLLLI